MPTRDVHIHLIHDHHVDRLILSCLYDDIRIRSLPMMSLIQQLRLLESDEVHFVNITVTGYDVPRLLLSLM